MNEEDSLAVVSGPSTGHWMCSRETGNVPGQPQATCANARKKHREYWKQAALCEALPEIRIANRVTEPLCARNSHLPFL